LIGYQVLGEENLFWLKLPENIFLFSRMF